MTGSRDATSQEEEQINGILRRWAEDEPQYSQLSVGMATVNVEEHGYREFWVDVEGCPSNDANFLARTELLRSASLMPHVNGYDAYRDAMLARIEDIDGSIVFFHGDLTAPHPNDEESSGHYTGKIMIVDPDHADEIERREILIFEMEFGDEAINELEQALKKIETLDDKLLSGKEMVLTEMADRLNRLLANVL